jgi:hypothetical protein
MRPDQNWPNTCPLFEAESLVCPNAGYAGWTREKARKPFFTGAPYLPYLPPIMDTVLSLLNGDLSIWGVIAMPIGVAICFGPALAVWLKAEMKPDKKDKDPRS